MHSIRVFHATTEYSLVELVSKYKEEKLQPLVGGETFEISFDRLTNDTFYEAIMAFKLWRDESKTIENYSMHNKYIHETNFSTLEYN